MATPTLKAIPVSGPTPSFAEPVEIYDLPAGGSGLPPAMNEITGTIPGITGGDLQTILNAISDRLRLLEAKP